MGSPHHHSTVILAWVCSAALGFLLWQVVDPAAHADDATNAAQHFTDTVLPLLERHCYECHSHDAEAAEGGLVLDSRAGWEIGGDSGRALVPGRPEDSLLMMAVGYSDTDLQMPPAGKLAQRDVDALRKWIADGAYDSRTTAVIPNTRGDRLPIEAVDWWSLRPVEPVMPPEVGDRAWIRNCIDRFILARLHACGLEANPAADRYALLRRATFDLTGLPPTLEEIEAFVSDKRPDTYERLLERLLASPHYGERWGRHWLDLARYGDSNGGDINYAHANAWRYRDYVIRSFNEDKPYDQFIREQLVGDLLPHEGDDSRRRELLTATGFLMLGPKMLAEVDTDKLLIDIVDEQLDVTGLTFLGLTFGCARCHDHKFDPITTEDYYALAGIFRSTKVIDVLRPSNGVSEWLEIDLTSSETLAVIQEIASEKEALQQQLVGLGASLPAGSVSANAANKAILASGLPPLLSTTWAAWVRIAGPQKLGAVISATYDGANQGHSLGFDGGATPRVVWNHGASPHTIIAAAEPISLGQWHHLALTLDAASQQLQLYVDGNLAAVAANVTTSAFSTIGVGRREASHQFPLIGDVDEVQVFDAALPTPEILALSRKRPLAVLPLLHWSFDRPAGDALPAQTKDTFDGRFIGVSIGAGTIDDGAIGEAFSFTAVAKTPQVDAERERQIDELRQKIQRLEASLPERTQVMAVAAAAPVDLPVHIRGSHLKLADRPIPRGTPRVFDPALPPVHVPPGVNGRLELANWIAHPDHPLTARVIVNRLWQHHFGTGLVRSSSNFGTRGELPSHPELLDWLAGEFVRQDWSIKHLHRLIMTSATYRMSSRSNSAALSQDPENRLLSSYPIRRLEAEAIRDSLLAATGELDRAMRGTLFTSPNKQRVTMSPSDPAYDRPRRAVYLPAVRIRGCEMLSIFDVGENGQHVAARPQTMVAQQALFLINNPFVVQRARVLSRQVAKRGGSLDERIDELHRRLYGRPATHGEKSLLAAGFSDWSADAMASRDAGAAAEFAWQHVIHALICANEFLYIR